MPFLRANFFLTIAIKGVENENENEDEDEHEHDWEC
jgi:hypothetical protein